MGHSDGSGTDGRTLRRKHHLMSVENLDLGLQGSHKALHILSRRRPPVLVDVGATMME